LRKLMSINVCLAAMMMVIPVAVENAGASPLNPLSGDDGFTARADAIQLMLIRDNLKKLRARESEVQSSSQPLTADYSTSTDIRGRSMQDDLRDFVESEVRRESEATRLIEWALQLNDVSEAHRQLTELMSIEETRRAHELAVRNYWQSLNALEREQNLWSRALTKNHLPEDMSHGDVVARSELQFRRAITQDTPLKETWRSAYKEWITALIADRNSVVRRIGTNRQHMQEIQYLSRTTPCPAIAGNTHTSTITPHTDAPARVSGPVPDINAYYPEESRREGVEGLVVLAMKINAQGCPTSAGISGSSGSDELDAAAMKFAEMITYNPAITNGEYVSSTQPIAINFKLSRQSEKKN